MSLFRAGERVFLPGSSGEPTGALAELFAADGQRELFGLIGSTDKQLIEYPGPHRESPPEAIERWYGFIADRLGAVPVLAA